MGKQKKTRKKKTINGGRINETPCGYCHFEEHEGFLKVEHVEKHRCAQKDCHYFERFNNHPYWRQYEIEKETKRLLRILRKMYLGGELSKKEYDVYIEKYKERPVIKYIPQKTETELLEIHLQALSNFNDYVHEKGIK